MRRLFCALLALLLALAALPGMAEDTKELRRAVQYPGQDISIAVPAQCLTFYKDSIGLTILPQGKNESGYLRVRVMPPDPDFSEAAYFEDIWLPYMRSLYSSKYENWLEDEGETGEYTLAGRKMIGRTCTDSLAGKKSLTLVAFDRWNGQIIRYEAHYDTQNPDPVLLLLSAAIRSVTQSALAPVASKQRLIAVDCPEQGFSFSADPSCPWKYEAMNGVTVYTQKADVIPYIMVYRSGDLIAEAFEYIQEQYTPHMKDQYGDDLIRSSEFDRFLIGGKELPTGVYTYRVQGREVRMIRIYDSTGQGTVIYTAKYINGEGDATMLALDAAVSTFHRQ